MGDLARERFVRWIRECDLGTRELAERLGCDRSYLYHLLAGRRTPGRRVANAIERESAEWCHGPIRSSEWDG